MNKELIRSTSREIEIKHFLKELSRATELLSEKEKEVDTLRDRKWECVDILKKLGHDFTRSKEGMDVVLSAPPSMSFEVVSASAETFSPVEEIEEILDNHSLLTGKRSYESRH